MEETISLKEIVEVLKKRLLLIISLVIGAGLISALITYFVLTPTYESSTQFIVNQSTEMRSTEFNVNDIRTNVELINTYNVIIKSPRILSEVAEELDLPLTSEQLSGKIQVASAQNSQVVTVTATDIDPETATAIANTTVETFQREIPQLMNVDNVKILSEADTPADPQPVNPNPMLNIAIAIVVGGMVGVGLAFLFEYLDNTIKSEADVEKELELPVLGVISHITEDDVITSQFNHAQKRRVRSEPSGQTKKSI
ncbi:Wzz/FepE/Etk N-terminal domain-containing protein [Aquibacillus sp. 3ASR75-11]|uniref:Wzz/FepE/Etk N-terminal domain-containing protein n=1 Tax=Terrihalobacillus insolitus TaxID=2950438 RepID=A0A9X3WTC4_9BACI|nr:Wzz/FepE/Etk N-terminal domain-containing protein [Terrihalobacillus insolitus]MDC3423496.1 Wzz/FepE/Etk N-terminal domain-containing protein [Terrihalobacillus insolitus]